MMPTLRIAWIAVRELLYEKVFYLLVMFAIIALGFAALLGQLTYSDFQKLTLDFMLGGIQVSMLLFSIFMGISLFQRELTLGSVAMILSKPISRTTFLLGKYFGQMAVQLIVIAGMGALTALLCVRMTETLSFTSLLQTLLMISFEVSVITAAAYFFAVNAGAITAAIATLSLFMVGHYREAAGTVTGEGLRQTVWTILKNIIPSLEIFNMKDIASYGYTLEWNQIGIAGLYALVCVAALLAAAAICFQRKDVLT